MAVFPFAFEGLWSTFELMRLYFLTCLMLGSLGLFAQSDRWKDTVIIGSSQNKAMLNLRMGDSCASVHQEAAALFYYKQCLSFCRDKKSDVYMMALTGVALREFTLRQYQDVLYYSDLLLSMKNISSGLFADQLLQEAIDLCFGTIYAIQGDTYVSMGNLSKACQIWSEGLGYEKRAEISELNSYVLDRIKKYCNR